MKQFLKLTIILFFTININAQYYSANDYFNPGGCSEILNLNNYSASTDYDFINAEPKIFNVHFYGLETTDGNNPSPFDETEALEDISALNIAFNPYNIFFKYRGIDYYSEVNNGSELINQSHPIIIDRMYEVAQTDGYDNSINIVLHHLLCNNDKGSSNIYKKIISLRYCTSSPVRVIYQMGHLLGLFKTQQGTGGGNEIGDTILLDDTSCVNNEDFISYYDKLFLPNFNSNPFGTPENVTRDTNNSNYNADSAGDFVTDTPACFRGSEHNFCHLYNGNSTYNYIENDLIVDNSSEHLMYHDVDLLNFMTLMYGSLPQIENQHFTNGQGVRMRETIAIPSLDFDSVTTDVASLYEPYKNTYYGAGPTLPSNRTLFQPGFDYTFVPCSGEYNIPSDYDDISFNYSIHNVCNSCIIHKNSLDFNSITHPNRTAIFIRQLNVNDLRLGGQPRKCYNNNNRLANSGVIIKYIDNVPNENVIIDPKNEQEINDENLIQNLDNGLYIIKKNYDDGTQEQRTINKSGN